MPFWMKPDYPCYWRWHSRYALFPDFFCYFDILHCIYLNKHQCIRLSMCSNSASHYNSAMPRIQDAFCEHESKPCRTVTSGRAALFCSGFDLHPAGQGEGDPVLGVDRHAVRQHGPPVRSNPVICLKEKRQEKVIKILLLP